MFADPQSLVLNGTTLSVPAVGRSDNDSQYFAASSVSGLTGKINFTVSHSYKRRNRFVVRIDYATNVADPFVPANYVMTSCSAYLVLDVPNDQTITPTQQGYLIAGLAAWLTASTNSARMIAGET